MKVLFLGPGGSPLVPFLRAQGEEVTPFETRLTRELLDDHRPEFLVSYGYRYILKPEVLARLAPDRAVNLHISLLPWNRGADPNLWSFLEDTPKGVTLHHLDAGVDTGEVIAQRAVHFEPGQTLRTSYAELQVQLQALFCELWPDLRAGRASRRPQTGPGSMHRLRDKEPWMHLLTAGWDTPVTALEGAAGKASGTPRPRG